MYSANDLKQTVIANVNSNTELYRALLNCEFQFNDTNEYTRVVWNTYKRTLVIFCPPEYRNTLEADKSTLFDFCDRIHGTSDDFLITSLEIMVKNELSSNQLTEHKIQISTNVIIDRSPENEIGKGGFGRIYKYYDNETEEFYAYKIYEPSIFQESNPAIMKKRFIREGKKLLHYSHENVVKAYDFGFLGDESAFIKLEYISGSNLIEYLTNTNLSTNEREKLCSQYISAMAYVHSKSDMHRDISYANVMVDASGNIKVLDFGFSRGQNDTGYDTKYMDIVHKFVLPNEEYTIKTEVYCIGAILFSIVTNSEFNLNQLSLLDTCSCNQMFVTIIRKCLSLNPSERFSDANEIQDTLISNNVSTIPEIIDLDMFRNKMLNGIDMIFDENLPTLSAVKKWFEEDFVDALEAHTFLTEINLLTILNKLPHLLIIERPTNISYTFNKTIFENMYNYYRDLSERLKSIFIKSILVIILEHSTQYEALPFE